MEWFTEPFALAFQQRALLGGILAAVMTSVVGTWLVLRGMSFFGDAFVHGVIPGIAAAVVLDLNPLVGAAYRSRRHGVRDRISQSTNRPG